MLLIFIIVNIEILGCYDFKSMLFEYRHITFMTLKIIYYNVFIVNFYSRFGNNYRPLSIQIHLLYRS